ncbi:MAG: hypothetical protein RLY47_261 [Candidatus Parcubacteria bacterium]
MYQQKEETRRKGLEGAYSLIFFKSSACLTGFFFLRYSRWVRRSATNPRRPRRECLSLRFFLRCFDKSSMRFEIRLTWTSGEPVSLSCRADDLMIVAFFFGESAMRGIVAQNLAIANTPHAFGYLVKKGPRTPRGMGNGLISRTYVPLRDSGPRRGDCFGRTRGGRWWVRGCMRPLAGVPQWSPLKTWYLPCVYKVSGFEGLLDAATSCDRHELFLASTMHDFLILCKV